MTLEAAYDGTRGAWLQGSLCPIDSVTPKILAARGASLSNSNVHEAEAAGEQLLAAVSGSGAEGENRR